MCSPWYNGEKSVLDTVYNDEQEGEPDGGDGEQMVAVQNQSQTINTPSQQDQATQSRGRVTVL